MSPGLSLSCGGTGSSTASSMPAQVKGRHIVAALAILVIAALIPQLADLVTWLKSIK